MNRLLIILFITPLLVSCGMGTRFNYTYELQGENVKKDNTYEDDQIYVSFKVKEKQINFNLENKSNYLAKVIWDESAIVVFGEALPITHGQVKFSSKGSTMLNAPIPPGAFINDIVVPTENIEYKAGTKYSASGWQIGYLLPVWDHNKKELRKGITESVGGYLGLFLPVDIQGVKTEYYFIFKITDVKKISTYATSR